MDLKLKRNKGVFVNNCSYMAGFPTNTAVNKYKGQTILHRDRALESISVIPNFNEETLRSDYKMINVFTSDKKRSNI